MNRTCCSHNVATWISRLTQKAQTKYISLYCISMQNIITRLYNREGKNKYSSTVFYSSSKFIADGQISGRNLALQKGSRGANLLYLLSSVLPCQRSGSIPKLVLTVKKERKLRVRVQSHISETTPHFSLI